MTIADGAEVQQGDLSVYEIRNKAQSGHLTVNGGRIICTNTFRSSSRFAMSNRAYVVAKDCEIIIKDSGILSGDGTLRGPVVNGGQFDPGTDSAGGSLFCSSGYQQTTNDILHVDLLGVPALDSYDVLQSSGDVTVDGVLQVNISGWTPTGEQDFQII